MTKEKLEAEIAALDEHIKALKASDPYRAILVRRVAALRAKLEKK